MRALAAFLEAVLGPAGAAALASAAPPGAAAERAARAWLEASGGCDTHLPGTRVPAVLVLGAGGWSGAVGPPGRAYAFAEADLAHAVAAVAHHLGAPTDPGDLRDVDRARLGRTVDLLVAAASAPDPTPAPPPALRCHVPAAAAERPCATCGSRLLVRGMWRGCHCLRGLPAAAEPAPGGYAITLGPGWDADAILCLREAIGG